jgi:hypothetical protein
VSSSTEAVIDIILTTIHTVGATELTGTMIAAVPRRRRNKTALPVVETAASTIYVGGKGSNGSTGKGRGKGDHRPFCPHGLKCKNFGTLTGCSSLHKDEDRAEMQHALGDKFVSREMRMRILALQAANPPTAVQPPAPPIAQHPPVTQPALSAAENKAQKAFEHFKALRAAQDAHPQDGSVPSGAAVTSMPHMAMCSVGRVPAKESSGSLDTIIPPGPATSRVIDVPYDMLLAENARLRNVITILAACGHHAATSLPSSPLYEQPVSAATSLMPVACSDNGNAPVLARALLASVISPRH